MAALLTFTKDSAHSPCSHVAIALQQHLERGDLPTSIVYVSRVEHVSAAGRLSERRSYSSQTDTRFW